MRYFIECTHTYSTTDNTGIQRVVRNLVNHGLDLKEREVVPVILVNGAFRAISDRITRPVPAAIQVAGRVPLARSMAAVRRYLYGVFNALRYFLAALLPITFFVRFLTAPHTQPGLARMAKYLLRAFRRDPRSVGVVELPLAEPQTGDVLALPDASWNLDIWPPVQDWQKRGVKVVLVVHDLIPITHSEFCASSHTEVFSAWLREGLRTADAFLGVSRTVAIEVARALFEMAPKRDLFPRVSYFWNGSDLDGIDTGSLSEPRPDIAAILADPSPLYIYVGTLDPRKNHAYALDAFDILWSKGIRARLVIIGVIGPRCQDLLARIRAHRLLADSLFLLDDASDSDLIHFYNRANGLVFTSVAEGFGLPIVEALQRCLPVFVSDIPVFREVAVEGVRFVDLHNPESLADHLADHILNGAMRLAQPVSWLGWGESTRQFWQRIDNCISDEPAPELLVGL